MGPGGGEPPRPPACSRHISRRWTRSPGTAATPAPDPHRAGHPAVLGAAHADREIRGILSDHNGGMTLVADDQASGPRLLERLRELDSDRWALALRTGRLAHSLGRPLLHVAEHVT